MFPHPRIQADRTTGSVFRSAKLRIERANKHIAELHATLDAFIQSDFYEFVTEPDPNTAGNYRFTFKTKKSVPDVGPIIGDALHNLRVPLDYVAAELVRRANETPSAYLKFPFRKTRDELESAIKGGQIKVAPKTVIDAIVDVIRPYPGGNDALYALHSLDIDDKHFDFIPVVDIAAVRFNAIMGGVQFTNCTVGVKSGGQMGILSVPGNQQIQGNFQPLVDVGFAKGQPFEGQSVIPTLYNLSQLVTGAVKAIENAFIASLKPDS